MYVLQSNVAQLQNHHQVIGFVNNMNNLTEFSFRRSAMLIETRKKQRQINTIKQKFVQWMPQSVVYIYDYVSVSFPGKRTNGLVITERFNSVRDFCMVQICMLKSLQVGVTIVSGTLISAHKRKQTHTYTHTHIQSPISNQKTLKH